MRCLLLLACGGALAAQDLTPKAKPQEQDIVLEHATLHTVSHGTIADGELHFAGGVIRYVGPARSGGSGLRIDCKGKHVYPGWIGANNTLGLLEIGQVRATNDTRETGNMTPEVRACVAVNPDSAVIPVTRSNGILVAGVFPLGGVVAGRASILQLEGRTWEDMTLLDDAGLCVSWPSARATPRRFVRETAPEPDTSKEQIAALDEFFTAAAAYVAARDADPKVPTDVRFEAMRPVLAAKKPVFLRADRLDQIEAALAWCKKRALRPVLVGGRDADLCLDLLVRERVPVMLLGTLALPRRAESPYDETFKLPGLLQEAGIAWCLASGEENAHERNLPYHAAAAVAFGLPRDAAVRAITLSAAEILGVADQVGSLDVGKQATLFVCDGDPLEITTQIEQAFIRGMALDLSNKQVKLMEKYR